MCLTHSSSVSVPAGNSDDEDTSIISPIIELLKKDEQLAPVLLYLTKNKLPDDCKEAIQIVAESSPFTVLDGILHYVSPDASGRARIVVPESWESNYFQTVIKTSCQSSFRTFAVDLERKK